MLLLRFAFQRFADTVFPMASMKSRAKVPSKSIHKSDTLVYDSDCSCSDILVPVVHFYMKNYLVDQDSKVDGHTLLYSNFSL
jgi:hypothetical protein